MKQQEPFKMKDIKNRQAKCIKSKSYSDRKILSGTAIHKQLQCHDLEVKEIMIGRPERLENLLIHTAILKRRQIRLVNFNQ